VFVVASDVDGYAVFLPHHPMVHVDCTEPTLAKSAGLVLKVHYPTVDAHVSLFSEAMTVVVSEQTTLEALLGRTEKLNTSLKLVPVEKHVAGVPGAMVGTLSGKVTDPKGRVVPVSQWFTLRQRPSDKRLFSINVAASASTPEASKMWEKILSIPDNPKIDPAPQAPDPKVPVTTAPTTTLM